MGVEDYALLIVLGVLLVVAAAKLFAAPLRLALRLLFSTLLGFAALLALNWASGATGGVALGLNLPNALVVGVLGAPGLVFLLLLQWVFV